METNSDKEATAKGGKKDLSVLEMLQTPVFVVDKNRKVVYGNDSFAELVGKSKEHLEGALVTSLIKSEISGVENALVAGDSSHIETWAIIKDRKYFFEYMPTPTYDSKGNVTGAIETIIDRTGQKLILQAVQDLAEKAKAGNLSARADVRAEGDYQLLVGGINEMLDALTDPLNMAADYIDRISKGDVPEKITEEYKGDFNTIKNNLNNCIDEIGVLVDEVGVVIRLAREGDLAKRANPDRSKGVYRKILRGINDALDAVLKPIKEAADCLKEMAQGNLDVAMKGDYEGDHAVIKDNLNATLAALNDILSQVAVAVDQVATGARQVSDSSQSLSQAATESASSLEEITASMHELTSQTSQNAENATQANLLAAQARMSAEKGNQEMANMVRAMNEINISAASISKIIKAIDEIAFQTNLLALNAAVEAARAGKHGKGFTVVAEEVRNLAQRSAAAAKETAEMIEGSIKKTEAGARIAEDTSRALEEIVVGSTKVTDLIGEIASASKEQAQGIGQINQGLSQVDQVTQQVTANAEESASASEELSSQSLQLKQMLTKFKLKRQGFHVPAAGLPEGITPEMLQMLKKMLQSQQMAAATGPSMRSGLSDAKFPKKKESEIKPSDVIALDDTEFGSF